MNNSLSSKTLGRIMAGFVNYGIIPAVPINRMLTVPELKAHVDEQQAEIPQEPAILYMSSPFCGTTRQARRERGAGGLAQALSEEVEIDG